MGFRRSVFIPMALALATMLAGGPACARTAPASPDAAESGERHPVLMISIDGMRPDAVLEADRHGLRLPVLRSFLAQGSYAREVVNVNPTVTNPNHTTLVTGVRPSEHGIYNNRPFAASATLPQSYSLYSQIKAPTLWHAAKAAGLTTASIFWPVTAGAADIDVNLAQGSDEDDAQIGDDAIALIESRRPDFLTVHFVSPDHRSHESGPFSPQANAALERIDGVVGRMIAAERQVHPDAVVVVVSDHGFDTVSHQVNLNAALVEGGFIALGDGAQPEVASWQAFAWYVGGMAMIVLEDPDDRQTEQRLTAFLDRLAEDPRSGIERIYRRDEIADAGLAPNAAMVVALRPGYRMGNAVVGPLVVESSGGAHGAYSTRTLRPDMHSSFFAMGPGIAAGKDLGTIDMLQIAPTVADLLKAPLPSATMPILPIAR